MQFSLVDLIGNQPLRPEDHHDDENEAEQQFLVLCRVELGREVLPGEVDDRDNLAPEIDDAFDMRRRVGHLRDGHGADDLLDLEDIYPELFIADFKGDELEQIPIGMVIGTRVIVHCLPLEDHVLRPDTGRV